MEKEKGSYHHENLRQELIEAGIRIVAENGVEALSLRRLAAECGVSHAAPYKHFKNKQEILAALTIHVAEDFSQYLCAALERLQNASPHERLVELGKSYVQFMMENPSDLKFLFFQDVTGMVTAQTLEQDFNPSFHPLAVFKETAIAYLGCIHADPAEYEYNIVAMWGMVHGLTMLLINHNWVPHENYLDAVGRILRLKFNTVAES